MNVRGFSQKIFNLPPPPTIRRKRLLLIYLIDLEVSPDYLYEFDDLM